MFSWHKYDISQKKASVEGLHTDIRSYLDPPAKSVGVKLIFTRRGGAGAAELPGYEWMSVLDHLTARLLYRILETEART